jgi:hypothetical protein
MLAAMLRRAGRLAAAGPARARRQARRAAAIAALATAAVAAGGACGDRAQAPPAQQAVAAIGSAGSGGAVARPSGPALQLPRASAAAPRRSTRPLGRADLERLARLEVAGWERTVRHATDEELEVRYRTAARPVLAVTIHASRCTACIPPVLAQWRARIDTLRLLLAEELRSRPDTTFELGEVHMGGATLVYTYQLGHFFGALPSGEQGGAYSSAYALYHNDGTNQLRAVAQYMDDPVATRAELAALAPREDLARIAAAFLGAYADAW